MKQSISNEFFYFNSSLGEGPHDFTNTDIMPFEQRMEYLSKYADHLEKTHHIPEVPKKVVTSEEMPLDASLNPDMLYIGTGMFRIGRWEFTPERMVFADETQTEFFVPYDAVTATCERADFAAWKPELNTDGYYGVRFELTGGEM